MRTSKMVLALNQATREVPSRDVTKPDIALEGAEERNSVSDEHRHACNDETSNKSGPQKVLNSGAAIDVQLVNSARGQPSKEPHCFVDSAR